jgi:methyl-accepting chemotaxis protein
MMFPILKTKMLAGRFIFHIIWMFMIAGPLLVLSSKSMIEGEIENTALSTGDKISHILWIHIGTTVFLILLGITAAFMLLKMLTRPLKEMAVIAEMISRGDFTAKFSVRTNDELSLLGETLNQMIDNVKGMFLRIHEASNDISSASSKIQSSVEKATRSASLQTEYAERTSASALQSGASIKSISEGINILGNASDATSSSILEMGTTIREISGQTAELSTAVDTTSSSIIEMTSSIKEVAENVEHLSQTAQETAAAVDLIDASVREVETIAKNAAQVSEKVSADAHDLGVRAIVKTIDGMKKIKTTVEKSSEVIHRLGKSSEDIGKILTVIKEVTKQTNLLALNAAILAAQAGEQGKGFAVVAEEIKKLADRTSASTNEISQLIGDVQTETKDAVASIQTGYESVEEGMRLSLAAGDAVGKILESSKNSADMARKIAEVAVNQVNEIGQVKLSMEKITLKAREVVRATTEQAKGGGQIMSATEKMRDITGKVRNSTAEQLQGSRQITLAAEHVNSQIQEMMKAIHAQRTEQEVSGKAILEIKNAAHSNDQVGHELNETVRKLVAQADLLMAEFSKIKV